jgi:hypothetical protein
MLGTHPFNELISPAAKRDIAYPVNWRAEHLREIVTVLKII